MFQSILWRINRSIKVKLSRCEMSLQRPLSEFHPERSLENQHLALQAIFYLRGYVILNVCDIERRCTCKSQLRKDNLYHMNMGNQKSETWK